MRARALSMLLIAAVSPSRAAGPGGEDARAAERVAAELQRPSAAATVTG